MVEKFRHAGELLEVALVCRHPRMTVSVAGTPVEIALVDEGPDGEVVAEIGGQRVSGWRVADGNDVFVRLQGRSYRMSRVVPGAAAAEAGGGNNLHASMPGVVVSIECAPGQTVSKGQTLIVIESMKMQTAMPAPRDGVIADVHVGRESSFEKGATLVSLQSASE